MKKSPDIIVLFSKFFIYFIVLVSALCIFSCKNDTLINNKPPVVDSNIVLRVDSIVLNTSSTYYSEQIFNFIKKLQTIKFQFSGESNIPNSNDPYIKLIFKSDLGDSVTIIRSGVNLDSVPVIVNGTAQFHLLDSCRTLKTQLGIGDTIISPVPANKYTKIKNLKIFYF